MNKYCDMGNGMYVYRMQHYPPKKSRFIGSMSGLTVYSSLGIRKHQTFSIFFIFRHGRKVTKKKFPRFFSHQLKPQLSLFWLINFFARCNFKTQNFRSLGKTVKRKRKTFIAISRLHLGENRNSRKEKNKITFNTYYNGLNQRLKWNNNAMLIFHYFFFVAFYFVRQHENVFSLQFFRLFSGARKLKCF